MLLTTTVVLLAMGMVAGFCVGRALVNACLLAQRIRLREDYELVTSKRRSKEEAVALLLPARV